VLDRLAQVIRRCLPLFVLLRNTVRGPIALDELRMIDRDVVGSLFEVVHRIPALAHHCGDELVRLGDRCGRVIDEIRLHARP
jgi:hypothetical protein